MTTPSSPTVSSGDVLGTTSLWSNALKHVTESVFVWMPVKLGCMYFNPQAYTNFGNLLSMDSTEIDEVKVDVNSATKAVSVKVKE
jgi:hypothetical protein